MSPWSIAIFALMLAGAGLAAWTDAREDPGESPPVSPGGALIGRIIVKIFYFFGIGGVSLGLAGAVLLSTGAVAGAAVDIIAVLHLGEDYPAWFVVDAVLVGLGVGLACARLLSASPPPSS